MSAAEFVGAIKDPKYIEWLNQEKKSGANNVILRTVTDMRKGEQDAKKTSFLLDPSKVAQMAEKLSAVEVTQADIAHILDDAMHALKDVKKEVVQGGAILFSNVSFATISTILEKAFASIIKRKFVTDKQGDFREVVISDYFQIGHVFSIAANTTAQTMRSLQKSSIDPNVKDAILKVLAEMEKKLREEDLKTSNIKSLEYGVYASYVKNIDNYVVEMQFEELNTKSGRESAPIMNAIKRYLWPSNSSAFNKFFRERAAEDEFITKLIKTKGSPSYLDMIQGSILSILADIPVKHSKYFTPKTYIGKKVVPVNAKPIKDELKKQQDLIKQARANLNKLSLAPKVSGQLPSLASLQILLDKHLQDVISANMGDGSATNVLNYRTGRFAASAKVERLSQSKEGMVTAFYSYMRNPYGTFSEGGAQERPKSRDPKTLISTSIKEIAATLVGNRMRAVLV